MPRKATATRTAKTPGSVLRPLSETALHPPASRLAGRPLRPETFRAEKGQPVQDDGRALSKFGGQFRKVLADTQGVPIDQIDLGLVRQAEALNADTDRNLHGLAAVQSKRTEHGVLRFVRMTVNTTMLLPWLPNGRALRRMGSELGGSGRVVTTAKDHPDLALPIMDVDSPDTVLDIVAAQRRLLGLESYSSTSAYPTKRDRVDSIVQYGVLEPLDVVLVQLRSPGGLAWVAQAAEGAQRLFSATLAMEQLANRSVGLTCAEHWLNGPATPALRDLRGQDLERLSADLMYPASAAAAFFPAADKTKLWLDTTASQDPAAVAFQLLRTVDINLIIAVEPDALVTGDDDNPVSSTVQEMIRSYHVPGRAKDQWDEADVQGLIAIGAIDDLLTTGRITAADRAAWLGEATPNWSGAVDDTDHSLNRLNSVTRLIASLTAQHAAPPTDDFAGGDATDSLDLVDKHLRLNGLTRRADNRAKVAAAQAIVTLGQHGTGRENAIKAAIFGTFHATWFWKTVEHPGGSWPALLDTPIQELAAKAAAEAANSSAADTCGPAQRALAALGGVALMTNPGLLVDNRALTRTGRGGGGKATNVKASDPHVLLAKMVRDPRGIDQLHDAVVALTANAEPTAPLDRVDREVLSDFYLRALWMGEHSDDSEDDPLAEFQRQVKQLSEAIGENASIAEWLATALPGEIVGLERGDDDDQELWGEPLYDALGIDEKLADAALPLLQTLTEFYTIGKAMARAAARAAR